MIRFATRVLVAILLAAIASLLAGFWLEPPAGRITEELLQGHARLLADELARTAPPQRPEFVEKRSKQLGYPVELEKAPSERLEHVRSEWRGTKLHLIARVPGTPGQVVLGPLPSPTSRIWAPSLAVAFFFSVLAAAAAIWPLLRQVREHNRIARQLARGNFAVRTSTREGDVLNSIGKALNQLADRMNQVLSDERDLLRTVAHEVRAPIARMRFRVEKIQRQANTPLRQECDGLDSDLRQVNELFEELLTYVAFDEFDHERPTLQPETFDAYARVVAVVDEVTATEETVSVTVHEPQPRPTVMANPKLFERAVTNLLLNALSYGGSKVDVYIREFSRDVIIDVQDRGPGIAEDDRPKVIRPFVRLGKKKTRGTGLGLAIVSRIMALHEGRLHILDAPTGGASIQLAWKKQSNYKTKSSA